MIQRLCVLIVGAALAIGCDSVTSPVAPEGKATITVTANPSRIAVTGSAEVTATAIHGSGVPLRSGTQISFSTDLGRLDRDLVPTDEFGRAKTTLRADGRAGTATIRANSGAVVAASPASVVVGTAERVPLAAAFRMEVAESLTVFFEDSSAGSPTGWQWTFGDGNTSANQNPEHTYADPGSYPVSLTASTPEESDTFSAFVTVPKSEATAPVASFAPPQVLGLTATFRDTSTGNPTKWDWGFGDGTASRLQHPIHTYAAAGNYTVRLEISNAAGSSTTSANVAIDLSAPPVARFDAPAIADLTATFRDTSTGNPTKWVWAFGDGADSTLQNPIHTYLAAGNYTVRLDVSNAAGSSSTSASIRVGATVAPEADFAQEELEGLVVLFRDSSKNGPTSWEWDFGDGMSDSVRNPRHTYGEVGTYAVALTASNFAGSSTTTKFVEVFGPLAASFTPAINGKTVVFSDASVGKPDAWEWSFGVPDATSDEANPVYIYDADGTYTVTLKVTRSKPAAVHTTSQQIEVTDP